MIKYKKGKSGIRMRINEPKRWSCYDSHAMESLSIKFFFGKYLVNFEIGLARHLTDKESSAGYGWNVKRIFRAIKGPIEPDEA